MQRFGVGVDLARELLHGERPVLQRVGHAEFGGDVDRLGDHGALSQLEQGERCGRQLPGEVLQTRSDTFDGADDWGGWQSGHEFPPLQWLSCVGLPAWRRVFSALRVFRRPYGIHRFPETMGFARPTVELPRRAGQLLRKAAPILENS